MRRTILFLAMTAAAALQAGGAGPGRAQVPAGFTLAQPLAVKTANSQVNVTLYAASFNQGNAVYLEIIPGKGISIETPDASFNGERIHLVKRDWGYRGVFGLSPTLSPGEKKFYLTYTHRWEKINLECPIAVGATAFHQYPNPLYLGKYANTGYVTKPEVARFINECTKIKGRVFSKNSDDSLGSGRSHPRDLHYVTSPFWASRVYYRLKEVNGRELPVDRQLNIHQGLDLMGKIGAPVFAIADGKVALARPMFYEGNFLVIDHGNRIFSYYMHLERFRVNEGENVTAGQLVADVGSTGMSTGPHLHVSLIIAGVQVDPLSILALPFRK